MKNIVICLFTFLFFSFTSASEEIIHFTAIYKIPINDPSLSGFNFFSINDYTVVKSENTAKIEYTLPNELTGFEDIKIVLNLIKEDDNYKYFVGAQGEARCQGPWGHMACSTQFNVKTNLDSVNEFLISVKEPQVREKLFEVAKLFSTEPIGESFTLEPSH